MATAGVQKNLTCTVCLEAFKDPRVLPCCHTFCKACLDRVLEKSGTKEKLSCPQCRGEHDVPADGFLTDFTVTSDLEVASALELGKQKPPCGECDSGDPSVAYCCDCQTYLCEYCSGGHKRMKHFRDHKVLPLDSLTPDVLKRSRRDPSCPKHLDKLVVAFCKTCQVLVCGDCIVMSHSEGHKYSAVDTATRKEVEMKLKAQLDRSKAKLTDLREGLGYIKRVEQQLGAQPDELKKAINATFDSLVATLETRRAQLLKETDAKCSGDLKKVWSQREVVERAVVGLETTVGFTERVLECASDAEFLSLSPQAFTRLGHLETTKWEVDTVCDLEETKREFLRGNHHAYLNNVGEMREVKVPLPLVIQGLPKSLPLGKKTEFTVASKSRRRVSIARPAVKVSYGFSRKEHYLRPVQKAEGKWVISFTPVCGGHHSLSLSVSGKKVEGSPFEFTVQGTPAAGDIVTRGPDWHYGNVDGGDGSRGTVRRIISMVARTSQDIHNLTVMWNNGNQYRFRWGTENGQYDIILVIPGT